MIFDRFGTFSQVVSFPQLSASGNTFEQPNSLVALIGRFFLPIWLLFYTFARFGTFGRMFGY